MQKKEDRHQKEKDIHWMQFALEEARKAREMGEVPVGAIIVQNGKILAAGSNQPISLCDPTAHAEIVALRKASESLQNYRLPDTTIYVTLEPCIMCAGALLQARIRRIVFGATDPKAGALVSRYFIGTDGNLNHRFLITSGIEEMRCAAMLKEFFASRRRKL